MEDWQLHSNRTGGYYRCNRFNDEQTEIKATTLAATTAASRGADLDDNNHLNNGVSQENRGRGSAAEETRRVAAEAQEAARFVHHFTRFRL